MSKVNAAIHGFNVGVVDTDKLTRVDLAKLRLAAETQTNLLPLATGEAFMRPGFEYIGNSEINSVGWLVPFVRGTDEAVALQFNTYDMRVLVDGVPIERVDVSTTVTNALFSAFTGWTDDSTAGASCDVSGGKLRLQCPDLGGKASCSQEVSVIFADRGVEHALRVEVTRGPVRFCVGSSHGLDNYVNEITLRTGVHSLAFTPTGTSFFVQFSSTSSNDKYVDRCQIETPGTVVIDTPWAYTDFQKMRFAQSVDVMFVASDGNHPQRIERRANGRSWSVVDYSTDDGPFKLLPTADIKMTPSVLNGNGTLTASAPFFKSTHVGALFRLFHQGQKIHRTIHAEDTYTDAIRVTGVYSNSVKDRDWKLTIGGTWSGTVNAYRSADGPDVGFHKRSTSYTTNTTATIAEIDDNQIIYYRVGFGDGDYTSGAADITIEYDGGGDYGICRVTGFTNSLSVQIEVLRPFKGTTATSDWREGEWSDRNGWPTAVALHDGRLWWGREDRFWGSVSDAFESFDEAVVGDSAPIARSITTGGINLVSSILPLQRLMFCTNGAESSARSSSLDEPLTATNITIRDASTVGCNDTGAVKVDTRGLFVDKSGRMVWEMLFDGQSYDYSSERLSRMASSLFTDEVMQMAVQRRPDTRIWMLLSSGSLICCVYEPRQEVLAFVPVTTSGPIKSICVLPETEQDRLYIYVQRTVNGTGTHMIERMAYDSEAAPVVFCKCVDSAHVLSGMSSVSGTKTVSGLNHLAGSDVVIWGNAGAVIAEGTVAADGTLSVPGLLVNAVVGIHYRAQYKSARLAYGAAAGAALIQPQRLDHLGIIMSDFHRDGVTYGPDFTRLDPLPLVRDGVEADKISTDVDGELSFPFDGGWYTDNRVCIQVDSPYPAHLLALVISVKTNDRT